MLHSIGTLTFSAKIGERLVVEVDKDFLYCYRWFLNKEKIITNKPRYDSHISVIRNEEIRSTALWSSLSTEIKFEYDPIIYNNDMYYWIAVNCLELEQIRKSFGLEPIKSGVTLSPDNLHNFHITIGNMK